jgi:hypothetical protein
VCLQGGDQVPPLLTGFQGFQACERSVAQAGQAVLQHAHDSAEDDLEFLVAVVILQVGVTLKAIEFAF